MYIFGQHNTPLVALSVVIAAVAAYTALDLSGRIRASQGWASRFWLIGAAVAMGGGIWSMHFVAMLALHLPVQVAYDFGLTALSLALAIGFTALGFHLVSRGGDRWPVIATAGTLMGLGIVAMHYTGMAAMRLDGTITYDPILVALSVFIALGASMTALKLAASDGSVAWRAAASLVMGLAVSGMHYTGMVAADIVCNTSGIDPDGLAQTSLALAMAATTFMILFLGLVAAMFDRRFAWLAEREANILRESEERFRMLYKRTPLPLHSLGRTGLVEKVSDAWLALLGYSREEVLGRPLTTFMTPECAEIREREDWPRLLEHGELHEREMQFVHRSGEVLDVLLSANVERDRHGDFRRSVEGIVDVTARKRTEQALRQAQKMEAVGQLTGGIAHDFNNLLMVVGGGLSMIERGRQSERLMEGMRNAIDRASGLTKQLLTFSRRQTLNPEVVDLPDLLPRLKTMLVHSLRPGIDLTADAEGGLWRFEVDAGELELAILNLVVNARDAMPDGGKLRIQGRNEVLDGRNEAGLKGEFVAIIVSDTGIGMDPDTVARVFEPFFTTKEPGKGTGLGLSQVYGFARQSGGAISVSSRPGKGTSFTLHLPRSLREPAPKDVEGVAPRPAVESGLVLLVEDTPQVATVTTAMLHEIGYEVVHAIDAAEALVRLRETAGFSLVLSDIVMPGGMDGIELGRRIRRDHPGLPILLSTGYSPGLDGQAASEFRILRKPYQIQDLRRALGEVHGDLVEPRSSLHA